MLKEDDTSLENIQDGIIYHYKDETKTKEKPKVIEFLKIKLANIVERLHKLINIQSSLYIEPKNQIEIEQNKRTNELQVKSDNNYIREQKEIDFDLEL